MEPFERGVGDPLEYRDTNLTTLPTHICEAMEHVEGPEQARKRKCIDSEALDVGASAARGGGGGGGAASSLICGSPEEEEERRNQDRERNRVHARNTRARKKKYMEELQAQLKALSEEKEAVEMTVKEEKKRTKETNQQWLKLMRKVFDMRAAGVMDEAAWSEVLTEDFKLTLPVTPYRSFNALDVVNNRRVMLGVEGMLSDVASLMVMCDMIGHKKRTMEGRVAIEYLLGLDQDSCFFGENGLMCTFMMRTTNAREHGAICEVEKSGILRVRFNEDKVEELEQCFDGIAFYHQLMRASEESHFDIVPNTLDGVLKDKSHHVVVTTAQRPFRITHVNDAWTDLCGFELEECRGKSLSILQGEETDMERVKTLCSFTMKGFPASMVVTNYNKEGRAFRNHLRCFPVSEASSGEITHIAGHLDEVPES